MGMGIGINTQKPDAGKIKGKQEPVALSVWFTSKGKVMPKMLKFQDEEGELHTISHIHVSSSAKRNYCGIPTLEFECESVMAACQYSFRLLYYIERQEWKIIWKNSW